MYTETLSSRRRGAWVGEVVRPSHISSQKLQARGSAILHKLLEVTPIPHSFAGHTEVVVESIPTPGSRVAQRCRRRVRRNRESLDVTTPLKTRIFVYVGSSMGAIAVYDRQRRQRRGGSKFCPRSGTCHVRSLLILISTRANVLPWEDVSLANAGASSCDFSSCAVQYIHDLIHVLVRQSPKI